MDRNLGFALLAWILFTAALGFWTYSWWTRDRPQSLLAFKYALFFWFVSILVLISWRVTSAAQDR